MKTVRTFFSAAILATLFVAPACAQQVASGDSRGGVQGDIVARYAEQQGDLVVKTVPLHHLSSAAAVKLLMPYVRSPGGGVFEVSPNIRAVTIREVQKNFNEMMTVLAQYDHDPATITLNFQLIAAENTNTRDPAVAGLDSLLRGVLKYTGYRLLNTSVATASEYGSVTQKLSAEGDPMTLSVEVTDLRADPLIVVDGVRSGGDASVHLNVSLVRDGLSMSGQTPGRIPSQLLSTGVTVPIGQTVVLGTSAMEGGQRALILTVRPQLVRVKR